MGNSTATIEPNSQSSTTNADGASEEDVIPVSRIEPPVPLDEDYFPMFFSSLQAGILAIVSQLLTSIYFAFQFGASIEIRAWANLVPYLAFGISEAGFQVITMWSSLASAAILIWFSLMAFVRRQRLQVKAGRLFAWLNIALIGFINLTRELYFDDFGTAQPWMWALVLVGCVAFAVGSYIIWVDFDDRVNEDQELPGPEQ